MDAIDAEPVPPRSAARTRFLAALRGILRSLLDFVRWAWKEMVVRHLFTVPAVLLAAGVLFVFPQTMNLLWQLPLLEGLTLPDAVSTLFFYAFLGGIIAGYLLLLVALMPQAEIVPAGGGQLAHRITMIPGRVGTILDYPAARSARSTVRRVARLGRGLLVLGLFVQLFTWWFETALPGWWRVTGTT